MPLYRKWQEGDSLLAIWKIEEPESYFREASGLSSDKKNETRRIEYLAGRFLLLHTEPDFPLNEISISELGKPYIPGDKFHFSISHSFPYIAVAISKKGPVGIDIQTYREKIIRLQHKFLSATEQSFCENLPSKLTLAWSAKEAVFKHYGLGAVDFIRHMPITDIKFDGTNADIDLLFKREEPELVMKLHGALEPEFSWSVTL